MAAIYESAIDVVQDIFDKLHSIPPQYLLLGLVTTSISILASLYLALYLFAPVPRSPLPSEKKYQTILPDGQISEPLGLPCWYDSWRAKKEAASTKANSSAKTQQHLDEPEIFVSVIVPAYNEQDRLGGMLEEAVDFLQSKYGDAYGPEIEKRRPSVSSKERSSTTNLKGLNGTTSNPTTTTTSTPGRAKGWEILVVSDGSTDQTVSTALEFARSHQLNQYPVPQPGPWTPSPKATAKTSHQIPHGSIRVVTLAANRGKGGAVTHGLRHARGQFVVFADADGASRFEDLEHLIDAARKVKDGKGRAIAIGSRAHLVGSDVVVKRSALRNALMRSFHLFIRILTPPATSRIRDTQCGFKLFTREALPDIVPYMHMEGWIFDVEMLMLGESAGIPMCEVPVGWKEVLGSKLNVVWDSIGMAVGLAVLRGGWGIGVYRR